MPARRIATALEALRRTPQRLLERPTLMLLVFNVAAQLVSVCASPLLTRLYSPEQFGVLGVITAIVMVCVPLATGRYELAIPCSRTDAEAFTLIRLCAIATALACVVAGGLAWLAVHAGPARVAEVLTGVWYFVPLGIACVALYDTLAIEASRQNKFRTLAFSKLSQVFAGVGGQVVLGLVGWSSLGLLIGFLLNQVMGVGRLFRELVAKHPLRVPIAWSAARAAASKHRRYPLFASWTSALDAAAKWSLQLTFAVLWSPEIGGFIFLTDRLVGRPLQLLSSSLLPVYVTHVSRALKENPADALAAFHSSLRRQASLSVLWTICISVIAPLIIGPLFGARWAGAVQYVQLMTLAIAPMAALHAVVHTLQLTGHQRLDAVLVAGKVLVIVAVVLGGWWAGLSALTTLAVFAASQAAFAVLTFLCYRHVLKQLIQIGTAAPRT
jgi:O-antigen/teichoic acid export membrane protein